MFLRQTGSPGFYGRYFIVSQEGWGVASNFGSAALESFSQEIQVQVAHYSYHRESDQIRGLVVTIGLKDATSMFPLRLSTLL